VRSPFPPRIRSAIPITLLAVVQCASLTLPALAAPALAAPPVPAGRPAHSPRAVPPATMATPGTFVDTFAGATATEPLYGLNESLDTRQTGTVKASYTRVSGVWQRDSTPPPSSYVQVGRASYPNRLSFSTGTSAVMLGAPVLADAGGHYTVATTVDPVAGDVTSADWGSIVLSRSRASAGYVTNADVDLGLTVRSNGDLELYTAGRSFWSSHVAPSATGYAVSVTVSTRDDRSVALAVNGVTFPVPVPSSVIRWPSMPYLYLGAYLSTPSEVTTFGSGRPGAGLSVSQVDGYPAASTKPFVETFDGAVDAEATSYGLNDGLRARQPSVVSNRYRRVSGLPSGSEPPPAKVSRVNHAQYPNTLSFWSRPSAVRLEKPVTADLDGGYAVHALVDPAAQGNDQRSSEWVSIMLSGSAGHTGYPTRPETDLGLTVRSNGQIQLYRKGEPTWGTEPVVAPAADGSFDVTMTVSSGAARRVDVVVNGTTLTATSTADLPRTAYLAVGAYPTDQRTVSTVDDLRVSMLGGLGHYGYFGFAHPEAPNNGVDHAPEVAGFTNLNQYLNDPALGFLDRCRPQSCAVYAGWAQFNDTAVPFRLWPDAVDRLEALKHRIGANLDKVGVIYLLDEPYGEGHEVSDADLERAVQQVRAVFPDKVIMLTLDVPSLRRGPHRIPTGIDWVGFDWYCQGSDEVLRTLRSLESQLAPNQRTFLMPESTARLCGSTDGGIAAAQSAYLDIAAGDPRVVALMNFGWWLPPKYGGDMNPLVNLPVTAQTQRGIGESITGLR
jgi:hypothetical protein